MFGLVIGKLQIGMKLVEVSDVLKASSNGHRSPELRKHDAAMQLTNEIVKSGAMQFEPIEGSNDIKVSLVMVK